MELVLENPVLLKRSIEIISDVVLEGTFVFKEDYVELVALNTNNVAMVVFRLLSTNFEKYEVESETKVSLSLEHLSNVLKSCDDKGRLTLKLGDNGKLEVISEGREKKVFEVSLIDFSDENLQKVPNLEFPVKVVVPSSNLTSAVNDLGFLEEGVTFRVKDSIFSIEGKTSSMSGNIEFKDDIDLSIEEEKEYVCRYSMEYLKKFVKADKIVDKVELSFNNDYPLKIEYKIPLH